MASFAAVKGQPIAVGSQEYPDLYLCLRKWQNVAHENVLSTQEDEACLFDDCNLGNMPCILLWQGHH